MCICVRERCSHRHLSKNYNPQLKHLIVWSDWLIGMLSTVMRTREHLSTSETLCKRLLCKTERLKMTAEVLLFDWLIGVSIITVSLNWVEFDGSDFNWSMALTRGFGSSSYVLFISGDIERTVNSQSLIKALRISVPFVGLLIHWIVWGVIKRNVLLF